MQVTSTTRDQIRRAAFALFAEQGYDETSVDDIATRAGVGRTTFFRVFGSKEQVIFPDHEGILARVDQRLSSASPDTMLLALSEAVRMVLLTYIEEADVALARYQLTRSVATLRDREIAGTRQYHLLFRRYLRGWLQQETDGDLRADLLAAAVVTAHNFVLHRWLNGLTDDPRQEFDQAIEAATRPFASPQVAGQGSTVLVLRSDLGADATAQLVRVALSAQGAQ